MVNSAVGASCIAGSTHTGLSLGLTIDDRSPDRYDTAVFIGQAGNKPDKTETNAPTCSVATFPTSSPGTPWADLSTNHNACGDLPGESHATPTMNGVTLLCQPELLTGKLAIPYTVTYDNSRKGICTGPTDAFVGGTGSKCVAGTASSNIQVNAYLIINKVAPVETGPFGFTVTGTPAPTDEANAALSSFQLSDGGTQTILTPLGSAPALPLPISQIVVTETSAGSGWRSTISCTGHDGTVNPSYITVDNDTMTITANLDAVNYGATCTVVNTKTSVLNVYKVLVPANDTGLFVMNANGTLGTPGSNGANAAVPALSGATVSFAETAGTGTSTSLANYTTTFSCDLTPTPLTGNVTTGGSFTMPARDTTCTFTNTRKSAILTLRKTWAANSHAGDASTVYAAGFINNATSGVSVATSGGNSTTGTPVTVYAGESGAIHELFSVGNEANYNEALQCSGNALALSGSTLTIDPADTAITCTIVNTRKSATLALTKVWTDSRPGDTATVNSSGFSNVATSGLATAPSTRTGSLATVYAGDTGTVGESFGIGGPNYRSTLACSGNAVALSGSTLGSALTIDSTDTAIACTVTNTRKSASLTLRVTWGPNSHAGDRATATSSGFGNPASSGLSTAMSGGNTTTGAPVTVYAGESGALNLGFGSGGTQILRMSPTIDTGGVQYTTAIVCSGNATPLSGNVLTINPADTSIVCSFTNTAIPPVPVPTLSAWGLALLSGGLLMFGIVTVRRRRKLADA